MAAEKVKKSSGKVYQGLKRNFEWPTSAGKIVFLLRILALFLTRGK